VEFFKDGEGDPSDHLIASCSAPSCSAKASRDQTYVDSAPADPRQDAYFIDGYHDPLGSPIM